MKQTNNKALSKAISAKARLKRFCLVIACLAPVIFDAIIVSQHLGLYMSGNEHTALSTAVITLIVTLVTMNATDFVLKRYAVQRGTIKYNFFMNMACYYGLMLSVPFWCLAHSPLTLDVCVAIVTIVFGLFVFSLLTIAVIGLTKLVYFGIKWIAWNGYTDTYIAITKRGNIKRLNRILSSTTFEKPIAPNISDVDLNNQLKLFETKIGQYRAKHFIKTLFW